MSASICKILRTSGRSNLIDAGSCTFAGSLRGKTHPVEARRPIGVWCASFGKRRHLNRTLVMKKLLFAMLGLIAAMGCSGRPELFPNSDSLLRKTSTEFAADAARRFPYKLDAPRAGEAEARAQVGYVLDVLEIENLSDTDWENVEVWVNQEYCVFLPKMESKRLKHLTFQMIFNEQGRSFPTDNRAAENRISKLELYRDGRMYDVKLQLAD